MSARRRIPFFAALLAAALTPPARAADPPPGRAIARSPAATPRTATQAGRGEMSQGTVDSKRRDRQTSAMEAPRARGSRPTSGAPDPRASAVRGATPRGSTGGRAGDAGAAGVIPEPTNGSIGQVAAAAGGAARGRANAPGGAPRGQRANVAGAATAGSEAAPARDGAVGRVPKDMSPEQLAEDLAVRVSAAADSHDSGSMSPKTATRSRPRAERRPAAERATAIAATTVDEPSVAPGRGGACSAALHAAPTLQYERARASLREFWWSDMARFFETSLDEVEPQPTQVGRADTVAADEAIRHAGLQRKLLEQLARSRSVDLLSERELAKVGKALAGASPTAIAWLLRADSPTLRAHVWHWLATTPAGVCTLARLERTAVDAAIRDRSVAVEHGEDLIFRPLGDYALAARARVAAADPQNFDALLRALAQEDLDPRVRAVVAGLRVRRGHAGSIEQGLVDPVASVRGAVAAAALDRDRDLYEPRLLEHAAADPADLVTELVVGELLGGPDGTPRGGLVTSRDPRIRAALSRWRGRGDPMAPLPAPERPLKLAAPKRNEPAKPVEPARPEPARAEPVEAETSDAPIEEHAEAAEPARPGRRAAETPEPVRPGRRAAEAPSGPQLPGVLDEPGNATPLP